MTERPGDLDPSALEQMHQSPAYQEFGTVPYNQVFMDQSGINSTQRRHYDLLMCGQKLSKPFLSRCPLLAQDALFALCRCPLCL